VVALRFTAGYAHHTPCGVKIPIAVRKQNFQSANADAIVRRTIAYLVIAKFLVCFCF
jgi:hypothetical protein